MYILSFDINAFFIVGYNKKISASALQRLFYQKVFRIITTFTHYTSINLKNLIKVLTVFLTF